MSLSFDPTTRVAMDEPDHAALMSRGGHRPLLRRAGDYYADAVYTPDEVPRLIEELTALGPLIGAGAGLAALCEAAVRRGCGLIAVAD
jgi:hypothetical protein